MASGHRQKCRLFLEGREVPFVGATLLCEEGSPVVASIDLVPAEPAKFIKPKTQVQIFVQDPINFGDMNFYLAFDGEVSARGFSKQATGSRGNSIVAIDYLGYLQEARVYYQNPQYQVNKAEEHTKGDVSANAEIKASVAVSLTGTATANSRMIEFITAKMNSGGDLLDGIVDVFKKLKNVNVYYKAAFDRLRIDDRIRVYSSKNLKSFLARVGAEDFLASYTGQHGGLFSMGDLLKSIMGLVFHNLISVPFPGKIESSGGAVLGNYLFVPDTYQLPPPKCNVIFPNQLISFNFNEDFRQAPTRFMFRGAYPEFLTQETDILSYPAMYYPDSFYDYMYGLKKNKENKDTTGLMAPSTLMKDSSGRTFANVFYGQKAENTAVGTSISSRLREQDFLTNDESIRGIFLSEARFPPSFTALSRASNAVSRIKLMREIGKYEFFKQRYAARNAAANLMFSPFIVPGFNTLIVDDSDSGQTVVAKIKSVTHYLSNSGSTTTLALGYARTFDEIDELSGDAGDPPVPDWFDPSIFGKSGDTESQNLYKKETDYLDGLKELSEEEKTIRAGIKTATVYPNLSKFYQSVLGIDAVTDNGVTDTGPGNSLNKSSLVTTRGAAVHLTQTYKRFASSDQARDSFVRKYTARKVPTMAEAMEYLGAKADGGIVPEEFAKFVATTEGSRKGRFDGKGYEDEKVLQYRRGIIDKYVELLKNKKGFRG